MKPVSVAQLEPTTSSPSARPRRWPWVAGIFLLLAIGGLVYASKHWPFTRQKVTQDLQKHFPGQVAIRSFHMVFVPHPGAVAEGVTVQGPGGGKPLISAAKLKIEGAYTSFVTGEKKLRIRADGLVVHVPREHVELGKDTGKKPTIIEKIETDQAVLEVERESGDPLRFDIHHLDIGPIGPNVPDDFHLRMRNAVPHGEVVANGKMGPFPPGNWSGAPITGTYSFEHADLNEFSAIGGMLSSKATISGRLQHAEVDGVSQTPDFKIKKPNHPIGVETRFKAYVDARNGDVTLDQTVASFGKTTLLGHGTIAERPKQNGKTVDLDLDVRKGRIEDLMKFAVSAKRMPLFGAVAFRGHAVVPPEDEKFLKKLQFIADFGIVDAKLTNPHSQEKVNELSAKARGDKEEQKDEDPDRVLENLRGRVEVRHGVAYFPNASFRVPGAAIQLHGTYNLLDHRVNFAGVLRMDATLSEATTGIKSFFLKALDPFFKNKKKHAGSELPIKITGTYSQPKFGVSLFGKKK